MTVETVRNTQGSRICQVVWWYLEEQNSQKWENTCQMSVADSVLRLPYDLHRLLHHCTEQEIDSLWQSGYGVSFLSYLFLFPYFSYFFPLFIFLSSSHCLMALIFSWATSVPQVHPRLWGRIKALIKRHWVPLCNYSWVLKSPRNGTQGKCCGTVTHLTFPSNLREAITPECFLGINEEWSHLLMSFIFFFTFWIDQDSSVAFEKPVFGPLIKHLGLFKRKVIKPVLEKFLCLLKVHLYVYECSSTTLCI